MMDKVDLSCKHHELSDLQQKLLEMLKWFHEFCIDNELNYYIVEGTVIGAIRHKGFIPWDDDIDIGMPRDDYNKLMSLMNKRNGQYILETPYSNNPDYIYPWCKLFDTSTTKIEKMRYKYKFGIYLDIFPIDGLGNTYRESLKNYRKIDFLNMLWATRVCAISKERSIYKNIAIILSRCVPKFIINEKKLIKMIDYECRKRNYNSCKYVSCTLSTYRAKEIMPKKIYGMPTEYSFEDTIVLGPEKYKNYLGKIYGEWWALPPLEKQKNSHDYIYLNLHKSYLEKGDKK